MRPVLLPATRVLSLGALLLSIGCSKEAIAPADVGPISLSVVSGDGQSGVAGTQLAQPLIAKVTVNGYPRPLQVLNFRVVQGNGSIFGGTELTDVRGIAQELWTIGTNAGDPQKVEVRAVDPVTGTAQVFATFTAVARPGATTRLAVSGLPGALTAGVSSPISATAQDAFGNTTIDYRGTVHFVSTDPLAVLPVNHTFVAADMGSFNATVILKTAGIQTVTATDVVTGSITGSQTVNVASVPPTISSFTAAPTSINNGTGASLTAVFGGGAGTIDHGVGTVTSGNPVGVVPTTTTTYTLTVMNAAGVTTTATATVTVVPFPTISSFAVEPRVVTTGGVIRLTGVFTGGVGIINAFGLINVPVFSGVPILAIAPTTAGTYTCTLAVTNAEGGTTVAFADLTVVPPPTITAFSAAANIITAGTSTTLTAVFGGGAATIDNGVGAPTSGTPISTGILRTATTFTLTVTNDAGSTVTATVTVTVVPAPTIVSFTAVPTTVLPGGAATLTGVFSGGSGFITDNFGSGVRAVNSGIGVSTGPLMASTIYTLSVTNNAPGGIVVGSVTVLVSGTPP